MMIAVISSQEPDSGNLRESGDIQRRRWRDAMKAHSKSALISILWLDITSRNGLIFSGNLTFTDVVQIMGNGARQQIVRLDAVPHHSIM